MPSNWLGSLEKGRYWKQLYIAFITTPDDPMIPQQDLVSGNLRFLGHCLSDLLRGLRTKGVHPNDVTFLDNCIRRQYILQYLEKVNPGVRERLLSKTSLMIQYRTLTVNTHGAAVAILVARGARLLERSDTAVEMAGVGDGISMDIMKEVMGVLQGEKTETVAGTNT